MDYKVVIQYKGPVDVEKFSQSGTLKYTSTESKSFKTVGDAMYINIAKDMFTYSQAKEYVNLKWSDIKGEKQDYEAYVNSNYELKKYYNENAGFQKGLLKTIKDKYFSKYFPDLEIAYAKTSIYKTDNFLEKNKDYLFINNLDDQNAIKLKEGQDTETISKILLADEKVITRVLKNDVFNLLTLEKNKKKYGVAHDAFLDTFLSKTELAEYKRTEYYKYAVAMGYAVVAGPVIKIGNNDFSYDHELPDFKLAISYSMNGEDKIVINKALIGLTLELFGVYKKVWETQTIEDKRFILRRSYKQNKNIWKGDKISKSMNIKEINYYFNNYK
ncbi:hypothetical protein [Spiroplasma endosymbiont of Atherix ibis]|uniref:hypothetical protein n=1 Tax=Spiroplasma endosymbiont of Atherix ibis TaxID=3066291 RepID=UPI0030D4C914